MKQKKKFCRTLILIGTVIILGTSLSIFFGCRQKDDDIPYTLADVERLTREKFFDENGNPILMYWENAMTNVPKEKKMPLHITGFTCSLIKDVNTGKEDGYFVEFDNTGYKYGKFGQSYSHSGYGHFKYEESPFKRLDVEQERRYVNLLPRTASFVGIMEDGLILDYRTYENIKIGNSEESFRAYDPEKKEWIYYDTIEEWMKLKNE